MVEPERIRLLNDDSPDPGGRYVLYWMQQSQREASNPALEYAVEEANRREQPVVVLFVLMENYPEANERHFAFMLEGLTAVAVALEKRGIAFVLRRGEPVETVLTLTPSASVIVCDRGYLRHQRAWRERVSERAERQVVQIEGDVVVPVEQVSDRMEFAARTIRPKILCRRDAYLRALPSVRPKRRADTLKLASDFQGLDPVVVLNALDIDRSVPRTSRFQGDTEEARKHLQRFTERDLADYADVRSDPSAPRCSHLAPYLHFGQISPVEIAVEVMGARGVSSADREAFLEQLIVRRELSINYVLHAPDYDHYIALPEWARRTLAEHAGDERPALYAPDELAAAKTHDPYWNAAMREMTKTGYMHNYMRMYWGKKIIEWSTSPERAHQTILALNNKYFVDGRDPNSYTSVAWLFGLHDRPWTERAIFGKVRYMNAAGLERKFDIMRYVRWVEDL